VKLNDKYYFIDTGGKEVTPLKYDLARKFSNGFAVVGVINGKVSTDGGESYTYRKGFVNKQGKEAIPLKYDGAEDFQEGVAQVRLKDKRGGIDKRGREIIPIKYDYIASVS